MSDLNLNGHSIVTDPPTAVQTPPASMIPRVGWYVDRFETLIQTQGYDAYIDRAYRCPCADRTTGQALTTCRNCMGRGWFFANRTETRLIAQRMDSDKRYLEWSEVNRGTASFTTRGCDRLAFMDRIILIQLIEYYSELLRPVVIDGVVMAYPVYEPLEVTDMYLFVSDALPLVPLDSSLYSIDKNRVVFDPSIVEMVNVPSMNIGAVAGGGVPLAISMRYTHYPVYHVIDINRELMRVREGRFCGVRDEELRAMPVNVQARKAHFIFDAQRWGVEIYNNTVVPAK